MPEFSFINQDGAITANDVVVTFGAVVGVIVAWRQRSKDLQIKTLMETIEFLKTQITYLQNQIHGRGDGK